LNTLLDGCAKTGDQESTLKLFTEMKSNNIKPSNVTFSILIKLYGNHNQIEKALDVLELMKDTGVKPSAVV